MKKVFVLGDYTSKSHYRKYMKIVRNLQKRYDVLSLVDETNEGTYTDRDIKAIKDCDYVVSHITGKVSNTTVAFLTGYAVALNKPLVAIISEYSEDLEILKYSIPYLLYSETVGASKSISLEELIS